MYICERFLLLLHNHLKEESLFENASAYQHYICILFFSFNKYGVKTYE